jgi:hypothetical protein
MAGLSPADDFAKTADRSRTQLPTGHEEAVLVESDAGIEPTSSSAPIASVSSSHLACASAGTGVPGSADSASTRCPSSARGIRSAGQFGVGGDDRRNPLGLHHPDLEAAGGFVDLAERDEQGIAVEDDGGGGVEERVVDARLGQHILVGGGQGLLEGVRGMTAHEVERDGGSIQYEE